MEKLTPEEVKALIKASRIARGKGIKQGANVKEICEKAGISRKTGYQWLKEEEASKKKKEDELQKLVHLKVEHQKLLKKNARLCFENEGMRLAMEIHGVDEAIKKNSI